MNKEILIRELKKITNPCETKELEKETISIYHEFDDDNVEYGCANNYINELETHEVYIFISTKNIVASNLLPYITKSSAEAEKKYNEYVEIIKTKDINVIKHLVETK